MKDKKYFSYLDIISQLDIRKNDIILVSSDILKLLIVSRENDEIFDSNKFIDTIIDKIGDGGTLLFPAYNWDFCNGKTFDYYNTPSNAGALSKVALNKNGFKRTKHPIHSLSVWGRDQEYLYNLRNITSWGLDSPFDYLYKKNAKNLFIGIDYKYALTFDHYVEEKVGVDYRYFKNFEALYIDENGLKKKKMYQMYVRDLSLNIKTVINPQLDTILLDKGHYKKYLINGIYFGLIDLHGVGDIMEKDIREKGGLVYPEKIIN